MGPLGPLGPLGPCTTANHFSLFGRCSHTSACTTVALCLQSHRCSQPSKKSSISVPGCTTSAFCLCYLPPPRGNPLTTAHPHHSLVTVAQKTGFPDDGAIGQPTGPYGHDHGPPLTVCRFETTRHVHPPPPKTRKFSASEQCSRSTASRLHQ